ncbi:MAG: hypothetical protein ABII72_03340 [Parcubacteria group bacterium]
MCKRKKRFGSKKAKGRCGKIKNSRSCRAKQGAGCTSGACQECLSSDMGISLSEVVIAVTRAAQQQKGEAA